MPYSSIIEKGLHKHWKPLDLGLVNANGKFPGGTIIDGTKVQVEGMRRFWIFATTVVTGGDRSAGTFDIRAQVYDSDQAAMLTAPINVLTGAARFAAAPPITYKHNISFGDRTAAVSGEAGNGTAGSNVELFRGPICWVSLHLKDNAAFSGGTTDPTTVVINVHLFGQSN